MKAKPEENKTNAHSSRKAIRQNPVQIKLLLLGDGRVGKTSLRRRYMGQGFKEEYLETLGADFTIKNVEFNNLIIRYNIWDIAGQPKFQQIRKGFFTGAQAALVLYDITEKSSFNNIENWINELISNNGKGSFLPIMIIGNKIDLRDKVETISYTEGKNLIKGLLDKFDLPNITFLETSAKNGKNVEKAFEQITKSFLEMHDLV